MDLDELNKILRSVAGEVNNEPRADFEGLSPFQMHHLLHFTFGENSPMRFRKDVPAEIYAQVPFLKLTEFFLRLIMAEEPAKLTDKGNLPTKIVKTLYETKFLPEKYIEIGFTKLRTEDDSLGVKNIRIISELAGLTVKRHNRLSVTKKAKDLLKNERKEEIFREIFQTFTQRFNWGYNDYYGDNNVGNLGFGFAMRLLSKYGDSEKEVDFYGEKYLKAYPLLLDVNFSRPYGSQEKMVKDCFSLRFFQRFAFLFGLATIREEGKLLERKTLVQKTSLLDGLFEFD